MDAKPPRVSINYVVHGDVTLGGALYGNLALERELREFMDDAWPTSATMLDPLGEPLFRFTTKRGEGVIFDRDGVLLYVALGDGTVEAWAAGLLRERLA